MDLTLIRDIVWTLAVWLGLWAAFWAALVAAAWRIAPARRGQ